MSDYKEAVDAGVEWLDANRPGWRAQIDRDTLRLANALRCVLGQTGGYDMALASAIPAPVNEDSSPDVWDALWAGRDQWADEHGFRVPYAYGMDFETEYEALTAEWLTRL